MLEAKTPLKQEFAKKPLKLNRVQTKTIAGANVNPYLWIPEIPPNHPRMPEVP